jgi:hypothetical protein
MAWVYHYCQPGSKKKEWIVAEVFMVLMLVAMMGLIAGPTQYAAVAMKRPLVDSWLAAFDARMGVSVPRIVDWTAYHPKIAVALRASYFTFLPQMWLTIFLLGFVLRDRQRLWEFAFHFHVCTVLTVAAVAVWPAVEPYTYYGFESLIDQARFIRHFAALRAGVFSSVRFDNIEGMVSVPSFHVAGALIVTWAFRKHRLLLWPLILLNIALTASTVMTGAHYLADVVASLPMVAASLFLYRYFGFAKRLASAPSAQVDCRRAA